MNILLKRSDRAVLLVGLFVGCIALAQPYLKAFLEQDSSEAALGKLNGRTVRVKNVKVLLPKFVNEEGKIDLNVAGKKKLAELSGIGPVLAGRVVRYRSKHGNFSSLKQLEEVNGIGPSTLDKIKKRIKIEGESS